MKDLILVVDDLEVNRILLREILDDYEVVEAAGGQECLDLLEYMDELPQAVLMDIVMPGMDGFETMEHMREDWRFRELPVLIITNLDDPEVESRGLKAGAIDFVSRPFNPDVVKARVDNCVQLYQHRQHLETLVDIKTNEVTETHERIMEVMATIIEYRSDESSSHIRRTNELCAILVKHMLNHPQYKDELESSDYRAMIRAMSLHDIGKVAIPDHILLKPGRLTTEEFEVIKKHTVLGHRIIESVCSNLMDITPYLRHCMDICRAHHERWDGAGYPDGLLGEEIPLSARILSVVDVFDALSSPRCYKPAFSYDYSINLIRTGRGTQFDPGIVDIMLEAQNEIVEAHRALADHFEEAVAAR